jgi:hypothetical protein
VFKGVGVFLVAFLMLITSIGIFGLLSKAHVEQGAPIADNSARIVRIEQRIEREQKEINDAQILIDQLDETINTLIDYDKISGPDGARAVRQQQRAQREELSSIIDSSEESIDNLLDQKFKLEGEVRAYETEVGPIKYIAALLEESPTATDLEKAVRILILILIFVFDPLAVWMLIAANQSFMDLSSKKKDTPDHSKNLNIENEKDHDGSLEKKNITNDEENRSSLNSSNLTYDINSISSNNDDAIDISVVSNGSINLTGNASVKKEHHKLRGLRVKPIKRED